MALPCHSSLRDVVHPSSSALRALPQLRPLRRRTTYYIFPSIRLNQVHAATPPTAVNAAKLRNPPEPNHHARAASLLLLVPAALGAIRLAYGLVNALEECIILGAESITKSMVPDSSSEATSDLFASEDPSAGNPAAPAAASGSGSGPAVSGGELSDLGAGGDPDLTDSGLGALTDGSGGDDSGDGSDGGGADPLARAVDRLMRSGLDPNDVHSAIAMASTSASAVGGGGPDPWVTSKLTELYVSYLGAWLKAIVGKIFRALANQLMPAKACLHELEVEMYFGLVGTLLRFGLLLLPALVLPLRLPWTGTVLRGARDHLAATWARWRGGLSSPGASVAVAAGTRLGETAEEDASAGSSSQQALTLTLQQQQQQQVMMPAQQPTELQEPAGGGHLSLEPHGQGGRGPEGDGQRGALAGAAMAASGSESHPQAQPRHFEESNGHSHQRGSREAATARWPADMAESRERGGGGGGGTSHEAGPGPGTGPWAGKSTGADAGQGELSETSTPPGGTQTGPPGVTLQAGHRVEGLRQGTVEWEPGGANSGTATGQAAAGAIDDSTSTATVSGVAPIAVGSQRGEGDRHPQKEEGAGLAPTVGLHGRPSAAAAASTLRSSASPEATAAATTAAAAAAGALSPAPAARMGLAPEADGTDNRRAPPATAAASAADDCAATSTGSGGEPSSPSSSSPSPPPSASSWYAPAPPQQQPGDPLRPQSGDGTASGSRSSPDRRRPLEPQASALAVNVVRAAALLGVNVAITYAQLEFIQSMWLLCAADMVVTAATIVAALALFAEVWRRGGSTMLLLGQGADRTFKLLGGLLAARVCIEAAMAWFVGEWGVLLTQLAVAVLAWSNAIKSDDEPVKVYWHLYRAALPVLLAVVLLSDGFVL